MQLKTFLPLLTVLTCAGEAAAADFTLKASVSGVDFDWALGANYEGEPAVGPQEGDKIIVPAGVTARVSAAASASNGTCGICDIEVCTGATLVVYDDGAEKPARNHTYVHALTGEGTVTSPTANAEDLWICSSCRFDGVFAGTVNFRIPNGVRFEMTRADHSGVGAPIQAGTSTYVIHRFLPASGSGYTPGYKSFNLGAASTVEYVGEEGLSEKLETSLWSAQHFTFDCGAYGGLRFYPYFGDGPAQRCLLVTGSNKVDSVLSPYRENKATSGPICIVKEGSGTWELRAPTGNSVPLTGTVAVRDGTLKYEKFAPVGSLCAFGLSTQLNRPAYISSVTAADAIPYALLFDGPAEKIGFLESTYVGGEVVTNYDRQIGLESSGGFRSGRARLSIAGVTAASSGEKLLVLDGAADVNDAVCGVSDGDGGGVVSIEKRGTGTWTVKPPFAFSGRIAVKAGRLELFNGGDRFNWYRLSIKENAFMSATYGPIAEEWFTTKVGTLSDAARRTQQLAKWNLMDENGKVRNDLTPWMTPDGAEFSAQPTNAYVTCCRPMEISTPNGRYLGSTRPIAGLFCTSNNWFNQTTPTLLDKNDESTWVRVVIRLADDVPEIKYCDFLASLSFPSDYGGRVPTALRVDASCDGLEWTTVFDRDDLVPPNGSVSSWYSGATTGNRSTLGFSDASSRFALNPSKPAPQPAVDLDATVSVAAGATLRCRGAFTISKVELSPEGMGTIEGNAALAAAGTLIVPELAPNERTKIFPTSLKDLPGAANLANWRTSCDGLKSRYMPRYDPATGNVLVMRCGLAVLFR